MALDPNQAASSRRIVLRALFLVAPLLVSAVAIPKVLASLRAARQPAALDGGALPPAEAEPLPKPPEAPTAEQIDEAVDATRALAAAERGWSKVELLSPSAPVQPGAEQTAPFQGFGLSIDSEPEGAAVTVDGRELGETPLLTGLPCTPGASLQIRVTRAPRPAKQLTTVCRADTLVKLRVRLGP